MMSHNGLAKLIEECGELQQVAGKRLAYPATEEHPDGGPSLNTRLQDEIADVLAACGLVIETHGLDYARVGQRTLEKLRLFRSWQAESDL